MTREELNENIQKEIDSENNKIKRTSLFKKLFKLIIILLLISSSFFFYTTYVSSSLISVREYRIKSEKIPDSFNGLKVIQFSDLHYGSTMFLDNVKRLVKIINERNPDLVIFTGDLIDSQYKLEISEQEKLISELKNIKSNFGKYAILGDLDTDSISTILNQSNFVILKNDYDLIYNGNNNPILLIGLSSLNKKSQDISKAYGYFGLENHIENIYTITCVHEPDSIDLFIDNNQTDLILSGHSHNGNVRVPFINYGIFKVKGALKYNQEYYKVNNSELFVSSGLGTDNFGGIRLFCRPSINFFRLSNK